eukprot:6804481-Pyramimonas_sp.AAC.1
MAIVTSSQFRGYVGAAIRPPRLSKTSDRLRRWAPPPPIPVQRRFHHPPEVIPLSSTSEPSSSCSPSSGAPRPGLAPF